MICIRVKTLKGKDTSFDVDEELDVKGFKQHIASEIGIAAERQKIIFLGKVLRDDTKLKDAALLPGEDGKGKVLHVVEQRLPEAGAGSGSSGATGTAGGPRSAPIDPTVTASSPGPLRTTLTIPQVPGGPHATSISNTVMAALREYGPAVRGAQIGTRPDMNSTHVLLDLRNTEGGLAIDGHSESGSRLIVLERMGNALNDIITRLEDTSLSGDPEHEPQFLPLCAHTAPFMPPGRAGEAARNTGASGVNSAAGATEAGAASGETSATTDSDLSRFACPVPPPQPTRGQGINTGRGGQNTGVGQSTAGSANEPGNGAAGPPTRAPAAHPTPADLARVLERMELLGAALAPHTLSYRRLLSDDPTFDTEEEQARAQRLMGLCAAALHYQGHMIHIVSDISLDLHTPSPRQLHSIPPAPAQPVAIIHQTIPLGIQVSAELAQPRQGSANSNNTAGGGTAGGNTAADSNASSATSGSSAGSSSGSATDSDSQGPSASGLNQGSGNQGGGQQQGGFNIPLISNMFNNAATGGAPGGISVNLGPGMMNVGPNQMSAQAHIIDMPNQPGGMDGLQNILQSLAQQVVGDLATGGANLGQQQGASMNTGNTGGGAGTSGGSAAAGGSSANPGANGTQQSSTGEPGPHSQAGTGGGLGGGHLPGMPLGFPMGAGASQMGFNLRQPSAFGLNMTQPSNVTPPGMGNMRHSFDPYVPCLSGHWLRFQREDTISAENQSPIERQITNAVRRVVERMFQDANIALPHNVPRTNTSAERPDPPPYQNYSRSVSTSQDVTAATPAQASGSDDDPTSGSSPEQMRAGAQAASSDVLSDRSMVSNDELVSDSTPMDTSRAFESPPVPMIPAGYEADDLHEPEFVPETNSRMRMMNAHLAEIPGTPSEALDTFLSSIASIPGAPPPVDTRPVSQQPQASSSRGGGPFYAPWDPPSSGSDTNSDDDPNDWEQTDMSGTLGGEGGSRKLTWSDLNNPGPTPEQQEESQTNFMSSLIRSSQVSALDSARRAGRGLPPLPIGSYGMAPQYPPVNEAPPACLHVGKRVRRTGKRPRTIPQFTGERAFEGPIPHRRAFTSTPAHTIFADPATVQWPLPPGFNPFSETVHTGQGPLAKTLFDMFAKARTAQASGKSAEPSEEHTFLWALVEEFMKSLVPGVAGRRNLGPTVSEMVDRIALEQDLDMPTKTGALGGLVTTITKNLYTGDLLAILIGDYSSLDKLRKPLKDYLTKGVLKRAVPTCANIHDSVLDLAREMEKCFFQCETPSCIRRGTLVHQAESRLVRSFIKEVMIYVLRTDPEDSGLRFGVGLAEVVTRFVRLSARLLRYLFSGSMISSKNYLVELVNNTFDQVNPVLVDFMVTTVETLIDQTGSPGSFDNRKGLKPWLVCADETLEDKDFPCMFRSGHTPPEITPRPPGYDPRWGRRPDPKLKPKPMAVEKKDEPKENEEKKRKDEAKAERQARTKAKAEAEIKARREVKAKAAAALLIEKEKKTLAQKEADRGGESSGSSSVEYTSTTEDVDMGDDGPPRPTDAVDASWHSVVPQDWIPVIERDIESQARSALIDPTLLNFSDAYIQATPAKRRKLLTGEYDDE